MPEENETGMDSESVFRSRGFIQGREKMLKKSLIAGLVLTAAMFVMMPAVAMASMAQEYDVKTWKQEERSGDSKNALLYSGEIDYPVFKGTTLAIRKVNAAVKDDVDAFKEAAEQNKNDAKQFYKENPSFFTGNGYFESKSQYTVSQVGDYLNVVKDTYSFSGGAHGYGATSAYVFSESTGEKVTLQQFLSDKGSDTDKVVSYLGRCLRAKKAAGDFYLDDNYEDGLRTGTAVDGCWYLTGSNLILIANPYTVASYAQGQFDFAIPFASLYDLAKTQPVTVFNSGYAQDVLNGWLTAKNKNTGDVVYGDMGELPQTGEFGWTFSTKNDSKTMYFVNGYGDLYVQDTSQDGQSAEKVN